MPNSEKPWLIAAALTCLVPAFSLPAKAEVATSYGPVFENSDINGGGNISRPELVHLQEGIFLQIDANDDGFLAAEEWNNWDPGTAGVSYEAVEIGKIYAAMARLFVGFDQDKDARLDREEMRVALFADFDQADSHHDGFLNQEEFAAAYLLPTLVVNDVAKLFGNPQSADAQPSN